MGSAIFTVLMQRLWRDRSKLSLVAGEIAAFSLRTIPYTKASVDECHLSYRSGRRSQIKGCNM